MIATIKYDSSTSIGARLLDASIGQWYTGSGWSATEASADVQALTEKVLTESGYSRYYKNIATWPDGDYIVEYIITSTLEVLAEESLASLITPLDASDYTAPDNASISAILADTGTDGVVVATGSKTGYALTSAYDPAKTAASQSSVDTLTGYIDTEISTILSTVNDILVDTGTTIPGLISALNNVSVADILAGAVDGTLTIKQALMVCAATLVGNVTGGGTDTIVIKGAGNSTTRVTATVDENGNRTVVLSMA